MSQWLESTDEQKETMFGQWQQDRQEFSVDQEKALDQLIEEGKGGKPPEQVQSEFESFLASLPPNFQTGLNKIIDVKNLMPEHLRALLMADSIDGMDETIRAAQYGSTKESGITHYTDRSHMTKEDEVERHDPGSVHGRAEEDDRIQQNLRDAKNADPNDPQYKRHHVERERLGTLAPDAGGAPSPEREKGGRDL